MTDISHVSHWQSREFVTITCQPQDSFSYMTPGVPYPATVLHNLIIVSHTVRPTEQDWHLAVSWWLHTPTAWAHSTHPLYQANYMPRYKCIVKYRHLHLNSVCRGRQLCMLAYMYTNSSSLELSSSLCLIRSNHSSIRRSSLSIAGRGENNTFTIQPHRLPHCNDTNNRGSSHIPYSQTWVFKNTSFAYSTLKLTK